MEPKRLLKLMIPIVLTLSIISLFLPWGTTFQWLDMTLKVSYYASITMPLLLIISTIMAIKVAFTYERGLKRTFLYISSYLAVLLLGNFKFLWPTIYGWSYWSILYLPLILDILATTMLMLSCFSTLRVVEARKINKKEKVALGLIFMIGILVVTYPVLIGQTYEIRELVFRIMNTFLVIALLPVLFLYLDHFRGEAEDSTTFILVMFGIVIATISDWLFEIITGTPHSMIMFIFQTGSIYDVILMISYSLILLGLFVHLNYEKWSLKQFESFKIDEN